MAVDFFLALLSVDEFEKSPPHTQASVLEYYRDKGFELCAAPPRVEPGLDTFNGLRWEPLSERNFAYARDHGLMCRRFVPGRAFDGDNLEFNYLCGECFRLYPKAEDPQDAITPTCPDCWAHSRAADDGQIRGVGTPVSAGKG